MATLSPGTSSSQVASLQKTLNKTFGYNVPEDGSYDDKTQAAVADLQSKLNLGYSSGEADDKTLKAMKEAAVPRTRVVVNGVEAWVTKEQWMKLRDTAGKRAGDAVRKYGNMARETKSLWDAHEKTRKDNWFWANVVDVAVGLDFPDKGLIDKAIRAADKMESDARACKLSSEADLERASAPIRAAYSAMDKYRRELFPGAEQLVEELKTIRDGCVLTLQVTAAVATGGASWQVQVGVSAGVAAYEQVLKEVDTASKTSNYSVEKGVANVFVAGTLDAVVGLILKGGGKSGGNLGNFLDKVADKAIEEVGGSAMKQFAKKAMINALNGGAQQMVKDGIKGIPGLMDPKKKFSAEDLIEAAAISFVKGAALKNFKPVFDSFGKDASKYFESKDFKGLGDIDYNKAGAEGVKKAIDKASSPILQKLADKVDLTGDPKKFEAEVKEEILNDAGVKKAVKEAEEKQSKGKK